MKRTVEQNRENPPVYILAVCRRALEWVEDPKLRNNIEQRIERLKEGK